MVQQLSLFQDLSSLPPVDYFPDFLTNEEAYALFKHMKQLKWSQNQIKMMGKWLDLPRLETMCGEPGIKYTYSGSVELIAHPWTHELTLLKDKVEALTGYSFQVVIGNYYQNGADYIGWHSDNEPSMGANAPIASISLGAMRKFQIRQKAKGSKIYDYWLENGSLLLMHPGCQGTLPAPVTKKS
ncbi:alpha-ketoglutarate-dependent dioxygenase AlkB family protein [Scytonema sp. PCC 10023]|uniref:alpha-ketoglutarate-dependent dioxygenase AlkB family protein n=1 Tax=Scytonema sp. PCC 10023 TaxID=1680591 RepID=UPI0039C730F2